MLPWLRLLRWTAVAGQSCTLAWVSWGLGIRLPIGALALCLGILGLTNAVLHAVPEHWGERVWFVALCLGFDVMQLTGLLHLTGGPHNPFSAFYLAHVALAAAVLPPAWAAGIAGISCAGFGILFLGAGLLPLPADPVCGIGPGMPIELHLRGMLVAFVLTTAAIVFLTARLQQALRRRDAELAAARSAAVRDERFVALATLAAGAAHELGTPLGTITIAAGELARAAKHLPDHPEIAGDAALIQEEAARCRSILDRLESHSDDAPRALDIGDVFHLLRERYPGGLELDAAAGVGTVYAPPEALSMALLALIKNGFDASPDGAVIRCSVTRDVRGVCFKVRDEGTGLAAGALSHAGEPFFTTKPQGQGTGLGLFLVKLFADRLGGEFRLESAEPHGTIAILILPVAPDRSQG